MRLLFVCTGSICRSAAAHLLVSSWSAPIQVPPTVRSAGTRALAGRPVHPFTVEALARLGVDAGNFASNRLTAGDV
jgi:protein-tyrosine-phosphatase